MAFVFQGNPNKFDIDDYLTRYPNIYWSVSRLGREIRIGDQIFICRSGVSAGALRGGGVHSPLLRTKALPNPKALIDFKKIKYVKYFS